MVDRLKASVAGRGGAGESEADADSIRCEAEFGKTSGMRIIQRVLRKGHDLVIKDAEPSKDGRGFRSVDMQFLRKCPCAV